MLIVRLQVAAGGRCFTFVLDESHIKRNETQNAAMEAWFAFSQYRRLSMNECAERSRETHGAQGRDRTTDTAIFSRMLYQLSYLGTSSPRGLGSGGL